MTMKFDLKTPCKDCPFRPARKFPLTRERVEDIVHAITRQDQTFACHKTVKHDDDGEHVHTDIEQHCAGALIMLEKTENPNQMMRIAERLGSYDRRKLDMKADVFDSGEDMVNASHWTGRGRMRVAVNAGKAKAAPKPKSRWPEPARALAQSK